MPSNMALPTASAPAAAPAPAPSAFE